MKLYLTFPEPLRFTLPPAFAVVALTSILILGSSRAVAQQITMTGNSIFWVADGQALQIPNGFLVKDNSTSILPSSLQLNPGDVILDTVLSLYKVHSVPASADAVFYGAIRGNGDLSVSAAGVSFRSSQAAPPSVGLTIKNGASGSSEFSLRLDAVSELGDSSVPVIWQVSQTAGSGFGDMTFSWDPVLEPVELSGKRLYVFVSGAWSVLPAANTNVNAYSLRFSGYNGALFATRFGIASGLSAALTATDPACTGGTGSIQVSASGGVGPRSYKLGSGMWQSDNLFAGLAAGTYTVYVKDAAGDEASAMVTITDPVPSSAAVTGNTVVCAGQSTTLTVSGGASYNWSGGLGTNASITVSPTSNTTYSVTVTNSGGCIATASVTVTMYVPQPILLESQETSGLAYNDGIICAGATVVIVGPGDGIYSWGDGSTSSSRVLTPACTTPYDLTVTDENGCTTTAVVTVTVNREPWVTQISGVSGSAGTVIHFYGTDLDNVTGLTFNGQGCLNLTIIDPSHISAELPASGAIQQISLSSSCGLTDVQVGVPVITSFTPGAGSVGTIVTLTGTNMLQLVSATVGGADAVILSRTATSAKIVVMPGTATGTITAAGIANVSTSTSSFTVNPTPYPYFQQGSKQTNSSANALQGTAVSVSADGNTAVIGGPGDNSGIGAAWVYVRTGSTWSQQAKLTGSGAVGASRQGVSVSLTSDGNKAVIGGPGDNLHTGAVWVFTRNGTSWTQQGNKLTGTGAIGAAQQGTSVSISGDGNTIASGGMADDNYAGAVWTFGLFGSQWAQQGDKLVGAGAVGKARQGGSVSLSENGNVIIWGGYQDNSRMGAMWVYSKDGCVWNQQGGKLVGSGGSATAWQGYSVALSADGKTAVTGGCNDNQLTGATWIYTFFGGNWTQQMRLVGIQAAGPARQGASVTLSADGNTVMTAGMTDDSNKGAVWVYKKTGVIWALQGAKIKGNNAVGAAKQGTSVAVNATGNTSLIGGPADNAGKGAFWVYVPAASIPASQQLAVWERATQPTVFRLDQNTPNPASGPISISFFLPETCTAEWEISDLNGRIVQGMKKTYPAGEHSEVFDMSGYSGVFYYRIITPYGALTRKMVIAR